MNIETYKNHLFDTAKRILSAHSPTGYLRRISKVIEALTQELGYTLKTTEKGTMIISVKGESNEKKVAVAAHCDTLGAMVRSLREDGGVNFIKVGGPCMNTLDGEYCTLITRSEQEYTGTFLSLSPSTHVYSDASSRARTPENMYVRLDVNAKSSKALIELGIEKGDYICIDPKTEVTESGHIKSRFLDDKISVACIFTVLKIMKDQNKKPRFDTDFIFTVYEETGHGASAIPEDISEMLAVDMGCIGSDLECKETQVSICVADSCGPYNYELTSELISLAKKHNIDYAADVYPYYGSDVGAALSGGHDLRGALIGTGVHASHGMERTHFDGLKNTIMLILAYLAAL